ncbi:MAG TPA: DUF2059 domain-containing protein [Candidatus Binatia bacterium]|nr:DUF2059 domain-containing protein [Candidatus Binatia bacterium]
MRKFLPLVLIFMLLAAPFARAQESPPSEESIRELMNLTQMGTMVDHLTQSLDDSTRQAMSQAMAGQGLSEKQEKIVNEMTARMVAMLKEEINPEALEPAYIEIYKKTLTQHEVDGMIAFYKTDAGRAVVTKMPVVMRQASEIMMQHMQKLFPKLQQMQEEMMRRLKEGQ